MANKDGFVKYRNGIDDHLRAGTISLYEAAIMLQISRQADYETGLWIGSADRLVTDAPLDNSVKKVRRALRHLKAIGWIKGWKKYAGKAATHYLVGKWEATSGRHKGERINLEKTAIWSNPVFESDTTATPERQDGETTATLKSKTGSPLLEEELDLDVKEDEESRASAQAKTGKQTKKAGRKAVTPEEDEAALNAVRVKNHLPAPDTPAKAKRIAGFDARWHFYNPEGLAARVGVSLEELRRALFYHWKENKRPYWRTRFKSDSDCIKNFNELYAEVDPEFVLPKPETEITLQPGCTKCDGKGQISFDMYSEHLKRTYKKFRYCDCRKEIEIPLWN